MSGALSGGRGQMTLPNHFRCVLKPDPCDPSPCGPGTMCMANKLGNPICRCLAGLVPKPDTITGCGPECTIDPDCKTGYICQNQKCVEAPDPCDPNPCGPGAECTPNGISGFTCKCPSGSFGDPRQKCTKVSIFFLKIIFHNFCNKKNVLTKL